MWKTLPSNACFSVISATEVTAEQGADPAGKVGGGRFQQYLVVKSRYGFTTARGMKYTLQYRCDKTMDSKMALHLECCFLNCIMVNKVTFVGFTGDDRPNRSPGPAPAAASFSFNSHCSIQKSAKQDKVGEKVRSIAEQREVFPLWDTPVSSKQPARHPAGFWCTPRSASGDQFCRRK